MNAYTSLGARLMDTLMCLTSNMFALAVANRRAGLLVAAGDQPHQAIRVCRLGEMVIESRFGRGADVCVLSIAAQGDQPRRLAARVLTDPPGEIEAAHDRQSEIHERQIRLEA